MPLPLSVNVTPFGNAAPPRAIDGGGNPVVVTVKVPSVPTVKVVALALLIVGACATVSVKFCTAFGGTPLLAVKVIA